MLAACSLSSALGSLLNESELFGDCRGQRDYEHGPHYLQPRKVTNFMWKWNVGMKLLMFTSCSIPCFAIWWQLSKAAA
eukprot:gene14794-20844_t